MKLESSNFAYMYTISRTRLGLQITPKRGVVSRIFGIGEARHFEFRLLIDTQEY